MKMMKITVLMVMILVLSGLTNALIVSVNDFDPKPAEAGKHLNAWFRVENPTNDPVEGSFIEIVPKDGLELSTGEAAKKRIGFIEEQGAQIIEYRLKVRSDAIEGSNVLEARLTQGDSETTTDLSISVVEKDMLDVDLAVGDITSDPSRIKPDDDDVKLEVTLLNLGDGRARSVRAELSGLPPGITLSESYSGTELIGNIPADETAKATFYIDVDKTVTPEEFVGQLKLSYKWKPDESEDEYMFEQKSLPLRIAVRPIPLYKVSDVKIEPEKLTAGDKKVKLTLTITNVGEEEGESVRVKVYPKTEQPFEYDKSSDFIAPLLEPGDSGQGTLEFDVDEEANVQTYLLDLEIKNVVGNDVITYKETLPIDVTYPKPDNPWSVASIGLVLLAIVIIFFVVRGLLRKNKKTQAKKVKTSGVDSYLDRLDKHKK